MQLKLTTDYALRILLYLYKKEQATAKELSSQLQISTKYINYMVAKTELKDYIQPVVGVKGGYRLKRKIEDSSLLEIIEKMEKTVKLSHCLEEKEHCGTCHTFATKNCPIKKAYERIQENWEEKLSRITIKEIVECR